jgi:D-3-phosphoglycerate dehydrogenase
VQVRRIDPVEDIAALADLDLILAVPRESHFAAIGPNLSDRLTAIIRVGVGYEDCDVAALTEKAIALVIPSEATRRPTAVAALTLILAVSTRLIEKHFISLAGPVEWARRAHVQGRSLEGKLVGLVGCGTIGRDLISISRPLGFRFAISDPALDQAVAADLGAELMLLDELLAKADIVTIHCPLNSATRHLIDARRLSLMKPDSILVNTSRGGVIDQQALAACLAGGRIAGAGLDVFEEEPPDPRDPILKLNNVVLSAHALNWTRELDGDLGRLNIEAIRTLLGGNIPDGIVNGSVSTDSRFLTKLSRIAAAIGHSLQN